jgi:hypothetical protein
VQLRARDALDTYFSGYRISDAGRIPVPDIRPDLSSIFKCRVKYDINKDIKWIDGFLFPYIKLGKIFTSKQYGTVTVSQRHFWKFY